MTSLLALLFISSFARADEPAPPADEVEESADGDAFATATQALGKAEKALSTASGLRGKVVEHDKTLVDQGLRIQALERKLKDLTTAGAPTADIDAAKRELAAAVKADADRAADAATRADNSAAWSKTHADRAEAAKREAEEAAIRAATSASQSATSASQSATGNTQSGGSNSMNSAPPPNRDATDPRVYGAIGVGAGSMFRQASFSDNGMGVLVADTDELSSIMLGGVGEVGYAGFDTDGRMNVGLRGVAEYNVGGGFAGVGEVVFGGFVEPSHQFRLEGMAGVSWETIPTDNASDYADRRWNVGMGAELVPNANHWGVLLVGRFLPDNDVNFAGSNAGEVAVYVRFRK